jgi:hypothetical protein
MAKINLKKIWSKALPVIKGIAPTAAAALGGPYGALAATAIRAALNKDSDTDAIDTILAQNPEELAKLKIAEKEIENKRIEMGISREAMYLADVQSARERHMTVQDKEPARLTYLAVLLLVAAMIVVVFWTADLDDFARNTLSLIIGALIANAQKGYNFFLGTSMGSKLKNDQISSMIDHLEGV